MADFIVRDICIPTKNLCMLKSWLSTSATTSIPTPSLVAAGHLECPSCMQDSTQLEASNSIVQTPQAIMDHGKLTQLAKEVSTLSVP